MDKWNKNNSKKKKAYDAKRYKNNSEETRARIAAWQNENPEKTRAYKAVWVKNNPEAVRAFSENYKERRNRHVRKRKITDPGFRLTHNLRTAMNIAFKNNAKSGRTIELLGCSIEELKNHLERLFPPGMSWGNYGRYGWHIDHIIPLSYFDMSDPEQQKRAWHYTNLQPLWAQDNIRKKNKIIEVQLVLL